MKRITVLVVGILLIASYVFAAPIDGRWTGPWTLDMGDGNPMDITLGFDLKADGNKLTGTSDGQSGPIQISNGKINGNNLSFDVTINFGGQDITINYTGVLSGNKLKLSFPGMSGTQEVNCTKQ